MPATESLMILSICLGLSMVLNSGLGLHDPQVKARRLCLNAFLAALQLALLIWLACLFFTYGDMAWKQTHVESYLQFDTAEQREMNNAILSVYNKCCSGCDLVNLALYTNDANAVCDNLMGEGDEDLGEDGWAGSFCNATWQLTRYPKPVLCEVPGPCFGDQVTDCWVYTDDDTPRRFPPTFVPASVCNVLQPSKCESWLDFCEDESEPEPTVGFPQAKGCGRGNVRKFVSGIMEPFASTLTSLGVTCAVFAGILAFELAVGACCLIPAPRRPEGLMP